MPPREDVRFLLSWRPASVLAAFGVWTGLAVLSIAGGIVSFQQAGRPLDLAPFAASRAINWYTCAVFTPLYIWMARRWPIERARWKGRVPAWLAVTFAIVPMKFALEHAANGVFVPDRELAPLRELIISGFVPETVAFWAMIAAILSIEYYDRWRHREVQAHALGRQLAEAKLNALSAQLRPHFLFNTLQGISTLLHRDARSADSMLTHLSDLLRDSLRHSDTHEVTLAAELATLGHYLAIQRIRFQDRLHVEVRETGAAQALVPHFILQPLVENAIEHGVARHAGPSRVDVSALVRDGRLVLGVTDDGGAHAPQGPRAHGGLGLANARERLAALYGDAASLDAAPRAEGGFAVTITMPLRLASGAALA